MGTEVAAGLAWFVPMLLTLAVLNLGAAYWVHRDAKRRGSGWADAWAVGAVFFGLIALAYYFYARRRLDAPSAPPTRTDRLVRNLVVAALLTLVILALGPPDPLTQAYYAAVALPVLLALAVLYTYRDVLASAATRRRFLRPCVPLRRPRSQRCDVRALSPAFASEVVRLGLARDSRDVA